MIQESIKIQCPKCGAVLNVKNPAQLVGKVLKCPVCQAENPFDAYPRVAKPKPAPSPEATQYDPAFHGMKFDNSEKTQYLNDEDTDLLKPKSLAVGKLEFMGRLYNLEMGVNIVGRMADSSKATVQIDLRAIDPKVAKTMSRHHVSIAVQEKAGVLIHLIRLMEDAKNATYINQKLMQKGDALILNNGDFIKMGLVQVKFVAK